MQKKTCVVHDTFIYRGGGERLALLLAKGLKSDLVSAFFGKESYNIRESGFTEKMIAISNEETLKKYKSFKILKIKWDFWRKTKFLQEYDTVIISGDAVESVRHCAPNAKKYYYCHTPPRYLFDQKDAYAKKIPFLIRPLFLLLVFFLKRSYIRTLKQFDAIFTNSKNTQKRIKTFTGYNATIIYPPVDTDFFVPGKTTKPYYVSFARLASIKRVETIVEAFIQMPQLHLKFTYSDNHPEAKKILKRVQGFSNIEPIFSPKDDELLQLIQESIATIYIPKDEDFGMSPVESMACGVPVIGVAEGGLLESIIDGVTGILIPPSASKEDLIKAVQALPQNISTTMRDACIQQAKEFDISHFIQQVKKHTQ